MIKVVKAKHTGFCFGVRQAVATVLKEAERRRARIYTLGPLVHNPQVVSMLEEKGIVAVNDVSELGDGVVAYRSHGIAREEEEYIRNKGLEVIDATCPFVKKVRERALSLKAAGYKVVIVGDREHPEVRSVLSYLDNDGIVLQNPFSIETRKIGVVSQTTQDQGTFLEIVKGLTEKAENVKAYNTICRSTFQRKKEALELAAKVDVMLIVGGKNSANTTKLYKMVKKVQPCAYHVEKETELRPEWFLGARKVGLAGGASTPDFLIDQVERLVKTF